MQVLGIVGHIAEIVQKVLQAARGQAFIADDIFEGQFRRDGRSAAVLSSSSFPRTLGDRSIIFRDVVWAFVKENGHIAKRLHHQPDVLRSVELTDREKPWAIAADV